LKLLITGGLGFVGSHLVDSLVKKNHKIMILTKTLSKKKNIKKSAKKIQIEKIDLTNFQQLGKIIEKFKPDVIIHLAGNASHSKSFENPLKDIDSNAKTTLFMLEKIRKLNTQCKFILGSTFIVIGKPKKLPVNENTPCNPTTIYGTNRLSSEYFCKIYHEVYGLHTNIFRITNSYGPREQIIPKKNAVNFLIYKSFKKEEISIYNQGKFFRDFIYIDDVISGINIILKKGKSGELYWISSGKKTWFYEFGDILEKTTGCKVKYSETPVYTKKVDVGNFVVSNSKLRKLGWSPKISVDVGVKKTLKFFQSN
jgi:UDP-glucose 4-epimerase|tara:strand:- start:484 stop:1416 length:933 start_codon:yes stop_codon:yes gene_type:complete